MGGAARAAQHEAHLHHELEHRDALLRRGAGALGDPLQRAVLVNCARRLAQRRDVALINGGVLLAVDDGVGPRHHRVAALVLRAPLCRGARLRYHVDGPEEEGEPWHRREVDCTLAPQRREVEGAALCRVAPLALEPRYDIGELHGRRSTEQRFG